MAEQNDGSATRFFGSQGDIGANSKKSFLLGTSWSALTGFSISLQPGSVFGALLSQKPLRDICQRGTSVTIQCQVDTQLALMFWYQQLPGQSLVLIATANQGSEATYESGFTKDKFPISRPNLTFSNLTVNSVNPEDSSFYFCSAGDTVPGTDQRPEQELQLPPAHLLLPSSHPEELFKASWREETTAFRQRQMFVCLWVGMSMNV